MGSPFYNQSHAFPFFIPFNVMLFQNQLRHENTLQQIKASKNMKDMSRKLSELEIILWFWNDVLRKMFNDLHLRTFLMHRSHIWLSRVFSLDVAFKAMTIINIIFKVSSWKCMDYPAIIQYRKLMTRKLWFSCTSEIFLTSKWITF